MIEGRYIALCWLIIIVWILIKLLPKKVEKENDGYEKFKKTIPKTPPPVIDKLPMSPKAKKELDRKLELLKQQNMGTIQNLKKDFSMDDLKEDHDE